MAKFKNPIYLDKEQCELIRDKIQKNKIENNGYAQTITELATRTYYSEPNTSYALTGKIPVNNSIEKILKETGLTAEDINLDEEKLHDWNWIGFDAKRDIRKFVEAIPDITDRGNIYRAKCPCGGTIEAHYEKYYDRLKAKCKNCGMRIS